MFVCVNVCACRCVNVCVCVCKCVCAYLYVWMCVFVLWQGATSAGHRDGPGHRHDLSPASDQIHESLSTAAGGVIHTLTHTHTHGSALKTGPVFSKRVSHNLRGYKPLPWYGGGVLTCSPLTGVCTVTTVSASDILRVKHPAPLLLE